MKTRRSKKVEPTSSWGRGHCPRLTNAEKTGKVNFAECGTSEVLNVHCANMNNFTDAQNNLGAFDFHNCHLDSKPTLK